MSFDTLTFSNMLTSSLRKKLNKRQGKDNFKPPTVSDDEVSSNPDSRVTSPLRENDAAIDFGDLSNTPPLPSGSSESGIRR
ncbi:hypothetical protein LTR53_020004, partial [Teratosphaeriaceae sp. CCFEE 6253]